MIGCPEEPRGRSFASHPEHGKEQGIVLGLRMAGFMMIEIGDSRYTNPRTL
jgi:hypothetical protein